MVREWFFFFLDLLKKDLERIPLQCWKHGFNIKGRVCPRPDEGFVMPSITRAARMTAQHQSPNTVGLVWPCELWQNRMPYSVIAACFVETRLTQENLQHWPTNSLPQTHEIRGCWLPCAYITREDTMGRLGATCQVAPDPREEPKPHILVWFSGAYNFLRRLFSSSSLTHSMKQCWFDTLLNTSFLSFSQVKLLFCLCLRTSLTSH